MKPRLEKIAGSERLYTRDLRITGIFESDVEQRVSPLYALYPEIDTTILAAPRGIQLHPRVWSDDAPKAEAMLDEMVRAHGSRAGRKSRFHAWRVARRNRRAMLDGKSRHNCRGRKLHRRPAGRAADELRRQLRVFS